MGYRAYDEFVSSVNCFEIIGCGLFRVTFFVIVDGQSAPADFALVMPLSSLPDAIGKALAVSGKAVFAREDGTLSMMH